MNKASLYRVFGDKHQLFMAALKNYSDIEFRETTAIMSESASPLTNLRAVVQKVCEDADSDKGCLMINSMVELAPHDPEVKDLLQRIGTQRLRAMADMIGKAQQAGEIREQRDPEKLARQLMVTLAGAATMVKGFLTREDMVEVLDELIESWI